MLKNPAEQLFWQIPSCKKGRAPPSDGWKQSWQDVLFVQILQPCRQGKQVEMLR